MKDNVQESEAKWCCEGDGKDGHTPECRYSDPKTFVAAVPERGAPPKKPVCLICGLPPDHEWHGVSNHVYVPKLAGHDSAGAAQPKMKDDPVYGAIRVAICDEYIAAGSPTPKENWLYSRLVEARTQFAYEAGAANSPSPEVRQAWVSVTEKFPPDNQPVLVLRSNDWHRMQIEYYCKNGPYDSGFFLDGEMDTNVTHWMPLPPGPAAPPVYEATRSTPAMERNVRFGGSLGPLLRLKKSIPLTVERPFVLIWENTEEYSQGDSLGQAMDDFGISVRQLWEKVHDGSPLGPELLRIRSLLEEYIEPQPGPAAPPATKEGK